MDCSGTDLAQTDLGCLIDRIMHTWSLIKMLPQSHLVAERTSLSALLEARSDLSEKELLILGLKHLHAAKR